MKVITFLSVISVFFCTTSDASVHSLRSKIQSILAGKQISSTVVVSSLTRKDMLYERNGNQLLIPASVAKLFTTYAALKNLKPTFTATTRLSTTGALNDGTVTGDLYIQGAGDASLTSERMWMLVNDLVRMGVRKVSGNIVADTSYFDEEINPESRPKYLKDEAYNAPIAALSFNFNTTTIYVRPGDMPGKKPSAYIDPENNYITLNNQATTTEEGSKLTLVVNRSENSMEEDGDTVVLKGAIPMDKTELRFFRNIVNPTKYTVSMFKYFCEQRGIKFSGKIREGKTPENTTTLLEFDSIPLWQTIWGMNKFSNNYVADMTLKILGAETFGAPGTREKGLKAVQQAVGGIGIPAGSYQFVDGSGLTRNTKVSGRQVHKILEAFYNDFSIGPEAIASLSIPGAEGTLKRRRPTASDVTLRAKTGSIDGVSSLAGYVPTSGGELLAFVIILNDSQGLYGKMSGWVDEISRAISQFTRK